MSWFSSQWNRWANAPNGGSRSGASDGPIRRIEVVWGRERYVAPRISHLTHHLTSY